MTGIVLQARIGSSRLPGKAMLDLGGKTVVRRAMDALRQVSGIDEFILATDADSADILKSQAIDAGFDLFVGSAENVLNRYAEVIRKYGLTEVVRATGDNPFVSSAVAEKTMQVFREEAADYAGLNGMPLGTGVEVVSAAALLAADTEAEDPYEQEHVCPFLYKRPERFKIVRCDAPENWCAGDASVTMDTLDEYRSICRLFESLYTGKPVDIEDLVNRLKEWRRN